jgi:hypothetical protein
MRLLIAGVAAVAAFAIAAPSFAQSAEDPAAALAPAPVPSTKPKPGTTAYCQTLKSASARSACLKKLHAQATPKAAPTKKAKKPSTKPAPDAAQLAPPPAASAAAPAPMPAPSGGSVAVPPLPQKTI